MKAELKSTPNFRSAHINTMEHIYAADYISTQQTLEQQAKELMPWNPNKCTYALGSLRQQIFACRTHNSIGLCYSCSIQCHTTCDIVELFTKRNFTCDCGTERDNRVTKERAIRCELRKNTTDDIQASENQYNQNFKGLFCDCSTEYDPDSEAIMLQCIMGNACYEDWYHDYCIMPQIAKELRKAAETDIATERTLPGFPDLDSFDSYICWKCVKKYQYYFERLLAHELSDNIFTCKLPHQKIGDPEAQKNENGKRTIEEKTDVGYSLFLKENYSDELMKVKESIKDNNDKLYTFLDKLVPHLIKDVPIYEPNQDEDESSEMNIFNLTRTILQNSKDRERAIEGLSAFHALKSKLSKFLSPFAENGEVVKEEDIKNFFDNEDSL